MIRVGLLLVALSLASTACGKRAADSPSVDEARTAAIEQPENAEKPATQEPRTADAKGDMPTLKITLLSGETYDLRSSRGRWVVLNFWATWCAPCLKEMPELDAYDAKRDDVRVIGLAYEEISSEDMRAFLEQRPVNYPIAIVDVYDPPPAFGTPRGLPMTYLIAPDGRIAERFVGPVTANDLDTAIEIHLRATAG
jgi:thiol-disulfide isomerase/thioredoxin